MESLSPEIQNLIIDIAHKNNIRNFTIDVNNAVSKEGDGYIGILNGLSIIEKDSDNNLNFVIKKAPTNENLRKQFPTRIFFLREIRMYEEVFPDFLKFQEEYGISNPFRSVTKLHGYIRDELNETLVLDNLKEQGYQLTNRQEPLDSHHLSLVVTEYAKLHAVSHAMKKLQPERFTKIKEAVGVNVLKEFRQVAPQEFENKPGPKSSDDKPGMLESFFRPTLEAAQNRSPEALEGVKRFLETFFEFMHSASESDEPHGVVSHGDCWSANLLFKYEDEETPKIPTKLCLIDWQMSLITTPVHDLSYFLFISAGKHDLNNYRRYLHLYHTSVSDALASFGLNAEDVYSYHTFENEWREKAKIGFFMNLIMMQQSLSEGKTHDFEKTAKEGRSVFDPNERKLEISELFKRRMGDLVEFLIENDII